MRPPYEPKKYSSVERWRPYVQRYLPNAPTEAILAWIYWESNGNMGSRTSLDERGIMQIHPGEAKGMGLSDSEFNSLLRADGDMDRHFQISAKFVRYKQASAERLMRAVGANFTGSDYWTFVKLGHGLPIIQSKGMQDFKETWGRPPTSFFEFSRWLRMSNWQYKGWGPSRIAHILNNAEAVGKWAEGGISGPLLLIAAMATAYKLYFM